MNLPLDIFKFIILPFINPKLFRIYQLRSVSSYFKSAIKSGNVKYIKIPSSKYSDIKTAYNKIKKHLWLKKPPEIWLDEGRYVNTIKTFKIPITIKGICPYKTTIVNGLNFRIPKNIFHDFTFEGISIENNKTHNISYKGISYSGKSKLTIQNCIIRKCKDSGIKVQNGNVDIKNTCIYYTETAIHIWGNSNFNLDNLNIYLNQNGIIIGSIENQFAKNYITNIRCHHNRGTGISLGGWYSHQVPVVIINGKKSEIYQNNLSDHKFCYGINTSYSAKLYIKGLKSNFCHDNFNNQNYIQRMNSSIIFA